MLEETGWLFVHQITFVFAEPVLKPAELSSAIIQSINTSSQTHFYSKQIVYIFYWVTVEINTATHTNLYAKES